MPLSDEVLATITRFVSGGFVGQAVIVEIVCQELYEPGELDPAEVTAAVSAATIAHEASKLSWPPKTDCDRLQQAFRTLEARGIIAVENAGFDQSDGYAQVLEALASARDPEAIIGYCFYHGQDLDRAVDGGGLYLAFGPREARDEGSKGAAVGAIVVEELSRVGLSATWSGDFRKRISLADFDWKRR